MTENVFQWVSLILTAALFLGVPFIAWIAKRLVASLDSKITEGFKKIEVQETRMLDLGNRVTILEIRQEQVHRIEKTFEEFKIFMRAEMEKLMKAISQKQDK
jgi:RNA binding exosome subunit